MSALGKLVASIVLDTAEFTKGTDKAQYEAAKAAQFVDKKFKDLESNIGGAMKGIAAAVAAGFTFNALKGTFDDLVKFRGELEKISVVTGASVEGLSKISQGAKLAGTDMGTVEQAMVKLTKGLTAANADTKDTGRALEYLGVAGRTAAGQLRDPAEVTLDIAKKLGMMADGANKTAIATALWGKAGAQMLPTMKELAENGDLLVKVTTQQAREAKAYEDALVRLHIAQGTIGKAIMQEMVVPMTVLVDMLTQAANGTDSLGYAVKGLSKDGSLTGWAEQLGGALADLIDMGRLVKDSLLAVGASVLAVGADAMVGGALLSGNVQLIKNAYELRDSVLDQANKRWATLLDQNTNKTYDAYREQLKITKLIAAAQAGTFDDQVSRAARSAAGNAPGFRGTDGNTVGVTKENLYRTENAQLDIQIQKLSGIGVLEQYITKLGENRFDKITPKEKEALINKEKTIIAMERMASQMKADAADHDADLKWREASNEAIGKSVEGLEDELEKLQFEATLIGLSNEQRQVALLLFAKEKALRGDLTDMQKAAIAGLHDEIIATSANNESLKQQMGVWDSVATSAGNFFGDLIVHGKSAFDSLKQSLKSFAADIIAFFAKRYILSMVAGASGTFGATAANAASGALGGMGNSLIGAGASAAGSWLGSAAGGGAVTGGFTSGVAAGWAGSPYAGAGALAELGSVVGQAANFLVTNPVGWIALAAIAAYAVFAQKKGGDKDSGAGSYSIGADGNITANALTDANRFYRADSHGMDSMVSPIVEATAKSFAAYAKIFGITDLATFVQSTDTDPRGTAPNRAATQAYLNGGLVFSANNQDLGRDAAALTPELQLQASRALLAAFQASNLQADLATLLGSVVAASAPQAAIDALFAQATDLSGVLKALGETKVPDLTLDSLRLLQQAGESLGQTFTRVAQDFLNAQGALNQAIAGRNPVFARNLTLTARNDIATQFLAGMGQELSNAWLERMALDPASFTGLNTASMSLLAQFLNLQTQLEQLDAQLAIGGSGVVPTLVSGLGAAGNAALDYARSLADARGSLADYLRGSLLSNLSPLSLTQKYDESQSQLQRLIGLATGGDIGAMGQIGGARDSFLGLSQQRFGFSPTYNSDFFRTFDQTNALANNAVTRPMTAADAQQQTAAIVAALTANNAATSQLAGIQAQLYDLVKNGISVNDPQVTALLQEMKNLRLSGGAVSQPAGAL